MRQPCPLDFLAKLAALIPRPLKYLVLYHGVLAARSRWRARVVAYKRGAELEPTCESSVAPTAGSRRGAWADLVRRAFGYDLLACDRCGGKMVYLSCVLRRDREDIGARGANALNRHAVFQRWVRLTRGAADGQLRATGKF